MSQDAHHSGREMNGRVAAGRCDWRLPVVFGLIAAVLGSGYALYRAPVAATMLDEQPRIAAHLASGHGFCSPMDDSPDAEPTNWSPPLYPAVMAGVYRLFGIASTMSLNLMLILNGVCLGIVVATACVASQLLFAHRMAASLAAAAVLLDPVFILRTAYHWDTFLALALFCGLCVVALAMARREAGLWSVAALALGCGLLLLTNTSYIAALPCLVLLAIHRSSWRRQGVLLIVAGAVTFATLAPWTLRNYLVFDRLMLVRGGPYLELWIGNYAGHSGWIDMTRHPSVYPPEGQVYRQLGEQAYWELVRERFWSDYQADPTAFWWRSLRRAGYVFVGPLHGEAIQLRSLGAAAHIGRVALDATISVLALMGLILAWRRYPRARWLPLLAASAIAPFLITHVSYRYLMPSRWLMLLLAGLTVAMLVDRFMRRSVTAPIPATPPDA